MINDYLPDSDIDPITGKLREKQNNGGAFIQTGINRKLLYTKPEVDALVAGATSVPLRTVTTTSSMTATDGQVNADATAGAFTVTAPDATTAHVGASYRLKKIDATANEVTLGAVGSQTIDGAPSFVLDLANQEITIFTDGANWFTQSMYKLNQLSPTLRKGKWPFDPAVGTIITEFQAGHGFTTSGADGTSNVNDSTTGLPIFGSQCATVVSAGAGASAILQNTSIASIDTTTKQVMVILKVDDITHLSSLNFSMGNGGFTNEYHIAFANQGIVTSGQWVCVTLAIQDASTLGSPTRTGITAIRVYHKDDNTGNKVTIHWGGVYFMPNAANQPGTPYPNGVASICFDDSFATTWDVAKPLLDAAGYRASEYVIKDQVGGVARLTIPQLQSMQDQSGWEINSHAYTDANHATRDTGLTSQQLLWDKSSEKEWLYSNGLDGQGYAYPGGVMNQSVVNTVRKYSRYARGTQGLTETYPAGDPYRLKSFSTITPYSGGYAPSNIYTSTTGKIDQAVTNASWLILTFHNIIPAITSVTVSGTTATVTFAQNHPFNTGASLTFAGFTPAGLNKTAAITCGAQYTTNTLTYQVTGGTGNGTVMGTALGSTTDCDFTSFQTIINKLVSSGIPVMPIGEVINGQNLPLNNAPVTSVAGRTGAITLAESDITSLTSDLAAKAVVGSVVPSAPSSTAASTGVATTAARSDHVHPFNNGALPTDLGLHGWNMPIWYCGSSTIPAVAGTLQVVKVPVPVADTITDIMMAVASAASSDIANGWVALYDSSKNFLAQSSDQSVPWKTQGIKAATLSSPQPVSAGYVYFAFWIGSATTLPGFARSSQGSSLNNMLLSAANSFFATADTGKTTTAPASLGAFTAINTTWWVGYR